MSRLQQLAERRALLIDRSAQQRSALGDCYRQLQKPAGLLDKGLALLRSARHHPGLVLGAGVAAAYLLRKQISFARIASLATTAMRWGMPLASFLLERKVQARKSRQ